MEENEEEEVDIFIMDELDRKYLLEIPPKIKYIDLEKKLEKVFKRKDFDVRFINILYTLEKNKDDELTFEERDMIYLVKKEIKEVDNRINKEEFIKKFEDENIKNLNGLLKLFLVKYIITNLKENANINNNNIILNIKNNFELEIFSRGDIREDIRFKIKSKANIMPYINYIDFLIDENELINLIFQVDKSKENEIVKIWIDLYEYMEFSEFFKKQFIKDCYFDYSITEISLFDLKDKNIYAKELFDCPNCVNDFLFYETNNNSQKLLYSMNTSFGMGIYFTDNLDYISFYTKDKNLGKTLPLDSSFSFIVTEIHYDEQKVKRIFNYDNNIPNKLTHIPFYEEIKKNYPEEMVSKNEINKVTIRINDRRILNKNEINSERKKGKFIANEYVITEKKQMLPLYGITMKRNEYFVIWRDINFDKEKNMLEKNQLSESFRFIINLNNDFPNLNIYLESNIEKTLELIKRKKYNKIILISNIGVDSSGKKFVEIARKILGFDIVVLFFSNNTDHLKWIQNFPNSLYANDFEIIKKFIVNYNREGLIHLKDEIEKKYNIKLSFNANFLQFPKFINEFECKDIIFEEISENFRKVKIKNVGNNHFLKSENKEISFITDEKSSSIWYITLMDYEITFYSNGSYLYYDQQDKKIKGDETMRIWKYILDKNNKFYITEKNGLKILAENKNELILEDIDEKKSSQLFEFIDIYSNED